MQGYLNQLPNALLITLPLPQIWAFQFVRYPFDSRRARSTRRDRLVSQRRLSLRCVVQIKVASAILLLLLLGIRDPDLWRLQVFVWCARAVQIRRSQDHAGAEEILLCISIRYTDWCRA